MTNDILVSGAAMLSTLNIIQAVLILGTLRKLLVFFHIYWPAVKLLEHVVYVPNSTTPH